MFAVDVVIVRTGVIVYPLAGFRQQFSPGAEDNRFRRTVLCACRDLTLLKSLVSHIALLDLWICAEVLEFRDIKRA